MNILIVDDEIDTLNEINFYVKKYNQFDICVTCTNPFQALDEAKKTCFDIALLDIEMPGMNGLELAEQLGSLFPDMNLAFITAYNNYATEAFEVNAIDYVLKPIREARLIKALDKLVSKGNNNVFKGEAKHEFYIQTFGKFIIRRGDNIVTWRRKKSSELLAYLLENIDIPVHKEKLCDLFWPDLEPKKALANLQSIICSIRNGLKEVNNHEILIKYAGDNYILHVEKVRIDRVEFENILKKALDFKEKNVLKSALKLYKGHYLEEEGWLWSEPKKEELRKKYIRALKILGI